MTTPRTDKVGIVVIIVAFVALAQLLFFTYQQREDTQCQADVNAAFLDTLQQRSQLNLASDESFETLITDVSAATTQADVAAAFADFEERKQAILELRESFEYPDVAGACT